METREELPRRARGSCRPRPPPEAEKRQGRVPPVSEGLGIGHQNREATTQLVAVCLWTQQTGTSYLFLVRTVGFQPLGSSSAATRSHLPFLGSDLAVRELESPALGEVRDTKGPSIFTAWCEFQPTTRQTFQTGLRVQGRGPQGLAGQTWSSFQCIRQNFHYHYRDLHLSH